VAGVVTGILRMRLAVMGALTLSKSDMPQCNLDTVDELPTVGVLLRRTREFRAQLDGTRTPISRLRKRPWPDGWSRPVPPGVDLFTSVVITSDRPARGRRPAQHRDQVGRSFDRWPATTSMPAPSGSFSAGSSTPRSSGSVAVSARRPALGCAGLGWTCPWSGRGLPEGTKVRRSAAVALGSGAEEGAIPAGTEDLTWTLATRG